MASSTRADTLSVELGERSYPIEIGTGLLPQAGKIIVRHAGQPERCFIVTDEHVAKHYLHTLVDALEQADISCISMTLPAGEGTKCFAELESLLDRLLSHAPDRKTPLIALGGGVIGDLTGFAASILLRGVPFVQVPTSLLAQVDSSVGGKTAINSLQGKNLIGSFYQPKLVLIDTDTLGTLPERELRAGLAEVIKYGCIDQPEFFEWLKANMAGLLDKNPHALAQAIHTSCGAKAAVVAADERETGRRALLNLGHSFGHALEALSGYDGSLLHGEAVAIGMVMAFDLSARLGHCAEQDVDRVAALLQSAQLPVSAHHLGLNDKIDALLQAMQKDKKNEKNQLTLILARGIGDAFIIKNVDANEVSALWHDYV